MCFGGGGSDKVSKEMLKTERERQMRMEKATKRINAKFSDPALQAQYEQASANAQAYQQAFFDDAQQLAAEKLQEDLARRGLLGGSEEILARSRFGQNATNEMQKLLAWSRGVGQELKTSDQGTKQRLLGLASSGLMPGDAERMAAESIAANAASAEQLQQNYQIGDLLAGLATLGGSYVPGAVSTGGQRRVVVQGGREWDPYAQGYGRTYGGGITSIGGGR